MDTSFDDIRPFDDDEVDMVLSRLLGNQDFFTFLANKKFGRWFNHAPGLFRWLVKRSMVSQLGGIDSVDDFQQGFLKPHIYQLVNQTIGDFTVSGLENLDPKKSYLFFSNHRDIAMDPLLVNFALHQYQFPTVRIAIGDNLLKQDYVADIMRLNKSFIVKRSLSGKKEKFNAFCQLSDYIKHSLATQHSIWIAHREGRSKDGNDLTDAAVVKMLYMSYKRDKLSFAESLEHLSLVPVSISYEQDPCDTMKAKELAEVAETGSYNKSENEDFNSIVTGISGSKGRVNVAFGTPLTGFDTPEALSEAVNDSIYRLYHLYPSHWYALKCLIAMDLEEFGKELPISRSELEQALSQHLTSEQEAQVKEYFASKAQGLTEKQKYYLYSMYANPVLNQLTLS